MRFLSLISFLFLFTLGCDKKPLAKAVSPPKALNITNEFVYLVSLEGFFTDNEIKIIHKLDPSIKYLLTSGHASQRKSDKDLNFKSAEEFVDIKEKNFAIIKKIKFGGTFMTDSVVFDVVEDSKHNHFITYAEDRTL